jgi:hypothetical protein
LFEIIFLVSPDINSFPLIPSKESQIFLSIVELAICAAALGANKIVTLESILL